MAGKDDLLKPTSATTTSADGEEGTSSSGKTTTTTSTSSYKAFSGVSVDGKADIQNGTGTPGSVLSKIGFTAEPNPMGDLQQASYHFSFYLDTDVESQQGQGNVFVIAETGLTGMNLQDVEIEGFVGPNIRTRNATATSITIKIYEPYGSQLPDLLFQAAVRMNIANYLKAPWFLKLKLHGYDEQGNHTTVGDSWLWKLVLIDIQSQISELGSVHTITAMPQAEVALNNQFCMLPSSVNSDGATVGDALKNIVTSMNDNIIQTYGASNPPFIEFAVEDVAYPYDTKVGVARPFDHKIVADAPQDSSQSTNNNYGVQTSQFGPGTDIPAVVDKLMARTDTGIMVARLSREKPSGNGPDMEQTIRDPASFMHRVETKVEYKNYDAVLGDYCKKITYIVKPYQSVRLLTSMGRAQSFDREKTLNHQKAQHAVDRMFLKKQYDYLFTGLNTEIEKFDINVNFRWAVSVPVMQNWAAMGSTPARVDNVALAQDSTLQLQQNKAQLDALLQKREELKATNSTVDQNDSTATEAARKAEEDLNAQISAAEQQNQQLRTIAGQARDSVNNSAANELEKRRKANPITKRIVDGEDDIYENAQGNGDYAGAGGGKSSFLPITIVQDPDAPVSSVRSGTSSDNNPNKSVYGALLNQLYGSFDGNLQNLELDIRGDPYWLGPGNTGSPYDKDSSADTPNFMNGEHIFVFRFKLPVGYDQSTGTVALAADDNAKGGSGTEDKKAATGGNSNIFTGFYATTQVVNHFREGRFTQTLTGVRIQGWTYENIIEGREVTVADSTLYSNSQAPAPVSNGGLESGTRGATGTRTSTITAGNLTEQQLLAATLAAEAGGEGTRGMQAVGNVIMNRTKANYRGDGTVSEVITAPSQFSAWNNASPASYVAKNENSSTYQQAYVIAGQLLSGQSGDITGGATSYLNVPLTAKINNGRLPSWYTQNTNKVTTKIGNHTFLKGV